MKLDHIFRNPYDSLIHMERFVNKGSPSGFTEKHTVSARYDPRSDYESFQLPFFSFPKEELIIFNDENIFEFPELIGKGNRLLFPIHPDMIQMFTKKFNIEDFSKENIYCHLPVFPTANGRTVLRLSKAKNYYIKLHYHGIIGRIHRALPLKKAIAGPEIGLEIEKAVHDRDFPKSLAILPERLAVVKNTNNKHLPEIGVVLRNSEPLPFINNTYLIPFFSLFSVDTKCQKDPFILCQLIDKSSSPIFAFHILTNIILSGYIYLVFNRGFVPEINAQNVLLEIDENSTPIRMVIRDLQGWEKDLSLRECNQLCCEFKSAPYKCISEGDGEKYFIRHSFSYDFKLGNYIFDEIVNIFVSSYNCQRKKLEEIIKETFHTLANGRESDYFPQSGLWYCHENILLTEKRPYVERTNPKYRRSK